MHLNIGSMIQLSQELLITLAFNWTVFFPFRYVSAAISVITSLFWGVGLKFVDDVEIKILVMCDYDSKCLE